MRLDTVTYLNEAVPTEARMPTINMTMSSSRTVKPIDLRILVPMEPRLREQSCLKLAAASQPAKLRSSSQYGSLENLNCKARAFPARPATDDQGGSIKGGDFLDNSQAQTAAM